MRNLKFSAASWEDYLHWQESDKKVLRRVNELLKDCLRSPFAGIGKPEPLKGNLSGWWSRRITEVDRLVYRPEGDDLLVAALRYHYSAKD